MVPAHDSLGVYIFISRGPGEGTLEIRRPWTRRLFFLNKLTTQLPCPGILQTWCCGQTLSRACLLLASTP